VRDLGVARIAVAAHTNSWGLGWGEADIGGLPYDYVLPAVRRRVWSLLGMKRIDSKQVGL
jgi:hypothetical protein